jgi:hypothetical protein
MKLARQSPEWLRDRLANIENGSMLKVKGSNTTKAALWHHAGNTTKAVVIRSSAVAQVTV